MSRSALPGWLQKLGDQALATDVPTPLDRASFLAGMDHARRVAHAYGIDQRRHPLVGDGARQAATLIEEEHDRLKAKT